MKVFDDNIVASACEQMNVTDLASASIGEVLLVAAHLESTTGIPFIRMDQGSPGLPANAYGVEAEKQALDAGVGSQYPPADGIPELKDAASRFVKAFLDVDISPLACLPTTGSVAGSFASFIACTQRIPGKDKILFINPGFPMQKSQLVVLGIGWKEFDIYDYRGASKLRSKLEEELASGDVAAVIFSNPNNPAWICLTEDELKVIGELATEHDFIVLEDLAYFCMDVRKDYGKPFEPPFVPTIARYTDNYMIMLSSSKIFSYAGQRIALLCVSDSLYHSHSPYMAQRYEASDCFGVNLVHSILYMITSGCTSSTQYAYAKMLDLSCDGALDFVADISEYARRAERMKDIFLRHGFHIVYDKDVDQKVGDGFFFSLGFGSMTSEELAVNLMYYGVSSISLSTTGSLQQGVRACTSRMREDLYPILEQRMSEFEKDYKEYL